MNNDEKPVANPLVMLREEFDDWAILFDPDTGNAFGLSPTGVYLWKHLDGEHTIDEMLKALRGDAADVPQEAGGHLAAFVEELTAHGLAGYDVEPAHDDGRRRLSPCPTYISEKVADAIRFAYEAPKLVNLSGEPAAGSCCNNGSSPPSGELPAACCAGGCPGYYSGCSPGCATSGNGTCESGTNAYACWGGCTANSGASCWDGCAGQGGCACGVWVGSPRSNACSSGT